MQKFNSALKTDSCNPLIMSYYIMLRETIHGIDKLIVTIIYQSVTIVTGCLTLSILLFEKLGDPLNATILAFILIIIAFMLTYNSQKRIKLYVDILAQTVKIAEELEDSLISDNNLKMTLQIEKNIKYAGMRGECLFLRSIQVFYIVEIALLLYFIIRGIFMIF